MRSAFYELARIERDLQENVTAWAGDSTSETFRTRPTKTNSTDLFSQAGKVDSVRVMRDMATGRARGFAFVEMGSDEDAQKAISNFNEYKMDGRPLVVNEARPKPEGGGFGGGGNRGSGGGRGGNYEREDYSGGGRKEPRW